MTEKTEGIVLNYIRYRDTSIIVRIYTRKYGLQSYIINGIRSKSSKKSIGLFQPLTILDLVVYHNSKKELHRLAEYKNQVSLSTIHYEMRKSAIALFLTEVLVKTLGDGQEQEIAQFDFFKESVIEFDRLDTGFENFHLYFLINYAYHLGFGIYDLNNIDQTGDDELLSYLSKVSEKYSYHLAEGNQQLRRKAIDTILDFYKLHVPHFGAVKSLDVLYQIFEE